MIRQCQHTSLWRRRLLFHFCTEKRLLFVVCGTIVLLLAPATGGTTEISLTVAGKMTRSLYLLLAVSSLVQGFLAPTTQKSLSVSRTPLKSETTGWDSFRDMNEITDVPSGEEQRKYRRTVYSHDDWKKHRSQDRFIYYLAAIFNSGVYKNLGREVGTTTAIATFVVLYNAIVGGFQDLEGVKQAALISSPLFPILTLPLTAFTLTSPSLGLLLGKQD
jgi:hypothetical protein